MTNNNSIQANIWKYYLATALMYFGFFTPILQVFYLDNNLTITKIAFLGVVWNATRILLEIPSGILADKLGRKKTYVIASLFAVLQATILIYANEYLHFLIASIFSASAYAFLSGTNTSIFYDTLKQLKRESEFETLWARQSIFQQIPLVISFMLSGFLYARSHALPFQLSAVFLLLSMIVVITLKEPQYHKQIEHINFLTHFSQSVQFIFNNRFLKAVLLFVVVFSVGSDLSYGFGQIYLKQMGTPIILFGIIYTAKSVFCTISNLVTPKIRKKLNYKGLFALQMVLITVLFYTLVLTKNYLIGAACFILIAVPHGMFEISKESYINKHTQSHRRATVNSLFSFFVAASILLLEPITGYIADLYTMKFSFFLIAILLSIYTLYYFIYELKKID